MLHQSLNGKWKMRELTENHYLEAKIPGSVMSALLDNQEIDDPFWRLNEYEARELFRKDYEFSRAFTIDKELYEQDRIELICYGLDTLTEIYMNDILLAKTNNMHRTWRLDCKSLLNPGDNQLRIIFRSPIQYIESYQPQEGKEIDYVVTGAMKNLQYIRKAHCMFGWDWGAQIPDAGIWRDIELVGYTEGRIEDVEFIQNHTEDSVKLVINTTLEILKEGEYILEYELTNPEGKVSKYTRPAYHGRTKYTIQINDPKLWWPNGYGEQPLYHMQVSMVKKGRVYDAREYTLGLRTLTISREKDTWGEEFAFLINGVKIFAKGADYIPEDTIYSNITAERIEYLIKSCSGANYNCLRVWGGGYYPSDTFYELCDQYGLIVWQDLMFACCIYELTEEFELNIIEEVKDNVRRLRHHASLGIWCGNNEIEIAWEQWGSFKDHSPRLKADYIKQFEYVIPKALREVDHQTFFWPSSPSSGGCFDKPEAENIGDTHYWAVWHGLLPFEDYRNHYFRFCSEFGFQSFPSMKTVRSFTEEEDRNIFTKVMESHQKNGSANGKIIYYLSENFLYPKDFESLLYVTQLLQGIAMKFGVEHFLRNRGRCMGALYWQANDSWPVASWSSIDYYGRWKALHYMAKSFYAPFTGSLARTGNTIEAYVHNETLKDKRCNLTLTLKAVDFTVLDRLSFELAVPALSAVKVSEKDYTQLIQGQEEKVFVEAVFEDENHNRRTEVEIFVPFKHLALKQPNISFTVKEERDSYHIALQADSLACFTELDFRECDAIFEDNYFYLTGANPRVIKLNKSDILGGKLKNASEVSEQLLIRSLRDTY